MSESLFTRTPSLYLICHFLILSEQSLVLRKPGHNLTVEFEDAEATFGPAVSDFTPMGFVLKAAPLNACSEIKPPPTHSGSYGYFALIHRGDCPFVFKVSAAQRKNFIGVIIVNNINDEVFPMGSTEDLKITIPSIMVGKRAGLEIVESYLFNSGYIAEMRPNPKSYVEYYLVPFLIVLSLALLSIIIFLVYRFFRICRQHSKNRLSRDALRRLPEIRFSEDHRRLYDTCVICLEDYLAGDKLRILPCNHAFHSKCVDRWLLHRQSSCPICKYRINKSVDTPGSDSVSEQIDNHAGLDSNSADASGRIEITSIAPVNRYPFQTMNVRGQRRIRCNSAECLGYGRFPIFSVRRTASAHYISLIDESVPFFAVPNFADESNDSTLSQPLDDEEPLLCGRSSWRYHLSRHRRSNIRRVFSSKKPAGWLLQGKLPDTNNTTWLGFDNPVTLEADRSSSTRPYNLPTVGFASTSSASNNN